MAVNPFTGEDDGVSDTLQPIVSGARNAASGVHDALFRDPESRSALLQIGLGLMQPMAQGQTVAGHIGQGIGAGGEAVGRSEEQDIKRQKADDALTIAELRLRNAKDPNQLTAYQRQALGLQERAAARGEQAQTRQDAAESRKEAAERRKEVNLRVKAATAARDEPEDIVSGRVSPERRRWEGQTDDQIRRAIQAEVDGEYGVGAAATDEPAPAAAAAPTTVTPPEKRVAGQVYPVPKSEKAPLGKLKWTGTGWVQP